MKKLFYILIIFTIGSVFSCAPLKKPTCEEKFLNIVKKSQERNNVSSINGSVYAKGIILLFKVSLKKNINVDLFTPFGQKIAQFYQKGERACLKIRDNQICGKYSDVYKEMFNEYIPFDLTGLITGKLPISEKSSYSCENNSIKITDNEFTYLFYKNRLKEVEYKDFKLTYEYENDKPRRVVIKNHGNTLLKIFIRDIQ